MDGKEGEIGEGGLKAQILGYKINKAFRCNAQHSDYI